MAAAAPSAPFAPTKAESAAMLLGKSELRILLHCVDESARTFLKQNPIVSLARDGTPTPLTRGQQVAVDYPVRFASIYGSCLDLSRDPEFFQQCCESDCRNVAAMFECMAMPMPSILADIVHRHLGVGQGCEKGDQSIQRETVDFLYMQSCVETAIEQFQCETGGAPFTLMLDMLIAEMRVLYKNTMRPYWTHCSMAVRVFAALAMPMPAPLQAIVRRKYEENRSSRVSTY